MYINYKSYCCNSYTCFGTGTSTEASARTCSIHLMCTCTYTPFHSCNFYIIIKYLSILEGVRVSSSFDTYMYLHTPFHSCNFCIIIKYLSIKKCVSSFDTSTEAPARTCTSHPKYIYLHTPFVIIIKYLSILHIKKGVTSRSTFLS